MVLYRGEPFAPPKPRELPESLNVPVWTVEQTGEWFTDYETYSSRVSFYKSPTFASELSRRKNISYFDAELDETQSLTYMFNNMRLEMQLPLCKYVFQLKELRLHKLVSNCFETLQHEYYNNDTVKFRSEFTNPPEDKDGTPILKDLVQPQGNIDIKKYVDVEYIVKDKTTFDAIIDEVDGKILVPQYSRYLLYRKDKLEKNNDNIADIEKIIVDGTQIERVNQIPSLYVLEIFIKLIFSPLNYHVISILRTRNIPLYSEIKKWNDSNTLDNIPKPKLDTHDPLLGSSNDDKAKTSTPDESNKRALEPQQETEDPMNSFKRFQKEHGVDEKSMELLEQLDKNPKEDLPYMEDLEIPFQGAMNVFEGFYSFNDELESIPLDDKDKSDIFYKNNPIHKLLEVYQFVLTFHKVLRIAPFNLDDLITSIKCSDPYELSGEIVNIALKSQQQGTLTKHGYPTVDAKKYPLDSKMFRRESLWQRNAKIRKMIKDKANDVVAYETLSNVPASDQQLEIAVNNGMQIFISVVISMLSLIIDRNGDWRCQIVEEWFENNHIDENALSMDATLETILNYKGVNWAERLSRREFHYGYWLIILLGVLQDSMHISKYTKIVINFTKKIIPDTINGNIPKNMFFNFCKKLTIMEKTDVLWVLMDIVANYSDDIKKWVNGAPKLVNEIKIERSRNMRHKLTESSILSQLTLQLDNANKNPNADEFLKQGLQTGIDEVQKNIDRLTKEEHYLNANIEDYDNLSMQPLGMDRFGNRYYWIYNLKIDAPNEINNSSSTDDTLYYCGRLWVRGAIPDMIKSLLGITTYQYNWWNDVAQVRGKAAATKEVFGFYRDKSGAYYQTENDIDVNILSENGQLVGNHQLTPLQRKIVNETPDNLLLDSNEWYFLQNASSIRSALYKLNVWGYQEKTLYTNIFKNLPLILTSFEIKDIITGDDTFNLMEDRLLSELKKYDCNEAELRGLEFINEEQHEENPLISDIKSTENLEELANNVISLHDTKLTRRILHRIKKLETVRGSILQQQMNILNFESIGIRTMEFFEKTELAAIANKKLRKQMDILTDLLNYRHFNAIRNLTKWKDLPKTSKVVNGQKQQQLLDVDEILRKIFIDIKSHIIPADWEGSSIEDYLPLEQKAKETHVNVDPTQNTAQISELSHQVASASQVNTPASGIETQEEHPLPKTQSPVTTELATEHENKPGVSEPATQSNNQILSQHPSALTSNS
ncbi:imitation switch two complex protein 1 [Monosporozyma unispora]|nr:hypothetical protein C6P44_003714 [Kazachstania unispora]